MKILQVVHSLPFLNHGGTEVYTYNLSLELSKRHEVYIYSRICDIKQQEYSITRKVIDKLRMYLINNTFKSYDSFSMTYNNGLIAENFSLILDEVKPDIVHIQSLLYLSIRIIEEVKKRGIPIIFTLHDYWLLCPQGQLLKNNTQICREVSNLKCIDCVLHQISIKKYVFRSYYFLGKILPQPIFQLIKNIYLNYYKAVKLNKEKNTDNPIDERAAYIKNACSMVDLFVSPSNFLRKKFIDFGIPENKIIFSKYGFNMDNFRNLKKTVSDKLVFAFIGNIIPAKGIHVLIDAFNRVKDNNVELRIYGRESSYKGSLGGYLYNLRLSAKNKNIRFIGGFENQDIAEILGSLDVLVVPSIWNENSPLVIQEAFLSGVLVVASNIGGIPELIIDRENGLLFDAGEADDLYEKIQYIIDNPDEVNKFKRNFIKVKNMKDNAKELEEIYIKRLAR